MSLLNDILNKKIKTTPNDNEQQTIQQVLNRQIDTGRSNLGGGNAPKKANLSYVTKAEQNEAARALLKSRERYSNYLQKQTSSARSQKLSKTPQIDITSRRNELEELASQNARALREASNTDEALKMRQDMREKQNVYNYSNYMRNMQEVADEQVNPLEKIISPIVSGPADLLDFSRLTGEQTYFDNEGNRTYLPTKRELKRQKVREESKGITGIYNDVVYNMGKAATAKLLDLATLGGGTMLYYGDIVDNSIDEAKKQGFSNGEALAYGGTVGVIAGTLDRALESFGGLSNFSDKVPGLTQTIDKMLYKIMGNKTAAMFFSNVAREGLSEFVEEFADNTAKYLINSDKSDADSFMDMLAQTLPDALYSGLIGGASGGVGYVGERNTIDTNERRQSLEDYKNTLNSIKPNTIQEAQYKEDQLNKVENQLSEMEQTAMKAIEKNKNVQQPTTEKVITQPVQEATIQENAPSIKQDARMQEQTELKLSSEKKKESQLQFNFDEKKSKTNYNIPEAKNPEVLVSKLSERSTPKQTKQLQEVLSEPSKNKTTVKFEDGTTLTTPSEKVREGGIEAASETIKNSVSNREFKEIELENKKRRQGYDNLENYYVSQGNEPMADYIRKIKNNDLYTVEHVGYELNNENIKLLEDPDTYYKKYNDELETLDSKNIKQLRRMEYKQMALLDYYGDIDSPGYNPSIANDIAVNFVQEGTDVAQTLAIRRKMYNNNPQDIVLRTQQTLNSLFRDDAKQHQGDTEWLNRNDPMKNSNSPYKLTDTQFATINYYANELSKIKDTSSTEYLTSYAQLNNYIQSLFGDKKLTEKMKRLTITNVLASTRIWTQNIKGNLVNLAQFNGIDKLVASSVDKIISNKSDLRTIGMSFEGDIQQGLRGYKQGIADSFYELKHDVSVSKFHSKYTNETSTDISNLGKKDYGKTFNDNTKVGKLLNKYENFVNFALDIGDRPFANMYYEQSIYNQRMLNAQINAEKTGKNVIYNVGINDNTKTYNVRYFDENGKKVTTVMNEKQYNDFNNKAVVQDITEEMCNIAEKEALEKTYQDDNKITRAALKMKDSLNEVFHIGDYGFGDMILKFTRTGSNMAKALYEHSPLEVVQLSKDLAALKRNEKAGTVTPELQHKVASEAGKMLGGAITMSIIGALNWSGLVKIEGKHDDDKEDKFKESVMGSQEFSFSLPGDNYKYKISNDSTIGSLLRMGVTGEKLYEETNSVWDTLTGMTNPFINALIDNSFMSTVLDLGNSYSDPIDNLTKKIASQPSNLIPSMMKDLSFALDNYTQRNTYDDNLGQYMINQIINKTPLRGSDVDLKTPLGEIKGLSGKTTAWGDVKTVGGDLLASVWNNWLTGDTLSKIKNDEISNEVIRVYSETNNTNSIPNLNITKNFKYNGEQFDLNEKEQNKYMTNYGKTAYKAVSNLMKTSQYKNATDDQKVKLLNKAYSYAKEKANQKYVEAQGKTYYNYTKKNGKYTEYAKPAFEEIIENDISIEEANYKRKNNNSYKLKTSITGFENYQNIAKDIKEIKEAYKNEDYSLRKYAIQSYINELNGLNSVQKAMLSKLENSQSDYASYDDKILSYIKSLDLTDEEYQYMYKQLGLGGYWAMYYKTKKNK